MQRYKINMNIRARIKNNYSYSAKTNFFAPEKIMKKIVYRPLREPWSGR